MRRIFFFVILILLLQLLLVRSFNAQSRPVVEGIVLESGTGRPLEGVRISLVSEPEPQFQFGSLQNVGDGVTNAQGRFHVETRQGRFRVIPALQGFVFSRDESLQAPREPGVWVALSAARPVVDVELRMAREAIISGRVLDSKGQPFPGTAGGATVYRYRYDEFGTRNLAGVPGVSYPGAAYSFVRMNDLGEFRLYGLQAGDYFLQLSGGGVRVFYPLTVEEEKAKPVHVNPGEELRLGTVTLPDPEKKVQVRLRLRQAGVAVSPSGARVAIDKQGVLMLPSADREDIPVALPPGHHDLQVTTGSLFQVRGTSMLYGTLGIDVATSEIEAEVEMQRGLRISGKFVVEDATGQRSNPGPTLRCTLRPELPMASVGISNCTESQVLPGQYRVEISGISMGSDLYIASATSSGRDILAGGLRVNGDTDIEVVLGTPGGVISGKVSNSKKETVRSAVVALVPDAPLRSAGPLYRSSITDIDGSYEIRGVAPGAYHLFAWSELEGAAYRNADFMKELEGRGQAVVVEKGARISADVEIVN